MLFYYLAALETDDEHSKFTYLYEKYKKYLIKLAMRYLSDYPDLAEDAVHDAFSKAIKHKEIILVKTPEDFERWSITVVERKCIDILRRRKILDQSTPLDDDDAAELASDDDVLEIGAIKSENHMRYRELLEKLSPISRQLFDMKYYANMSYTEISDVTGMSFAQITGRLQRARARMKALIKNLDDLQ